MNINSNHGDAIIITQDDIKEMRLTRLRKTIYNFGTGVDEHTQGLKPWLFTLTYAKIDDFRKNHLRDFIKIVRSHLYRRKIDCIYSWVAEFQKRGAIHYHIIFWLPKRFALPKVGRCGWWPHGFTDQKIAKKSVGYLLKYVSKKDTKFEYRKGMRIYGVGGKVEYAKRKVRFYRASQDVINLLKSRGKKYYDVDIRKVKGGRVDNLTGEFFESLWKFLLIGKYFLFYKAKSADDECNLWVDIDKSLDIIRTSK